MGQRQRALGPALARVQRVVEEEEEEGAERRKPPGEGGTRAGSRAGGAGGVALSVLPAASKDILPPVRHVLPPVTLKKTSCEHQMPRSYQ